jgi:hypothetical protein
MSEFVYDVTDYEIPLSFEPVPEGTYRCEVVDWSEEPSRSSGNPMLTLTWKILDGDFSNTAIKEYFVMNPGNELSHKINMGRLKRMVWATGVRTRFVGRELMGKICEIRVTVKPKDDGGNRNEIADHKPVVVKRKPGLQGAVEADSPQASKPKPQAPAKKSPPPAKAAAAPEPEPVEDEEDNPF